jgi:hypothetical protein
MGKGFIPLLEDGQERIALRLGTGLAVFGRLEL